MESAPPRFSARSICLVALTALASLAALRAAQTVVVPLLYSCFLAVVLSPIVVVLVRRRWPVLPAVLSALALVFALAYAMGCLLVFSLQDLGSEIPRYADRFVELAREFGAFALAHGVELDVDRFIESLDVSNLAPVAKGGVGFLLSATKYAAMVFFVTLFMLLEGARLKDKARRSFGERNFFDETFRGIALDIQRYLVVKTFVSLLTGVAVAVFLAVVGVPFPLLWGIVAFLFNYVPSVGSAVASVPPVLMALMDPVSPIATAVAAAVGLLVIQVAIGSYLDPRLMGKNLNLSALVVFLSMIFWGWMWGPAGMLIAVPLTVCVKVGLAYFPKTAPFSKLLES